MHSSDLTGSVSRRGFVRALGVAGAAWAAAPLLKARSITQSPPSERSLVVIHLAGGHDGRSVFVPCDDEAYYRARPTLALQRNELLRLGESVWLNRAGGDLAPLWERGELAVLPHVGFAPASLSHYRATQVWLSGSGPEDVVNTRWTERCGRPVVDLPGDFESALAQIAARVADGGTGAIYHVRLEGFDTHFEQRAAHDASLATFARGVAQFQQQLARKGAADRVLTLAFSEFGRALEENEFGGTHHAATGQCYFIGAGVRGGQRHESSALTEHRRVIATAAEGWLGAPASCVLGEAISPLPVLI
jgi:uncharacterized protein (DUF1501 family)